MYNLTKYASIDFFFFTKTKKNKKKSGTEGQYQTAPKRPEGGMGLNQIKVAIRIYRLSKLILVAIA